MPPHVLNKVRRHTHAHTHTHPVTLSILLHSPLCSKLYEANSDHALSHHGNLIRYNMNDLRIDHAEGEEHQEGNAYLEMQHFFFLFDGIGVLRNILFAQ